MDNILVIIPIYKKVSNDFYNRISEYKNVLLLDNNIIDKKALPKNKNNNFTIININEEWGDYIKNSKCNKFTFLYQDNINITNKHKGIFINYLTNYLFNSSFKGLYDKVLVFDQSESKKFKNIALNGFKSNIAIYEYAYNHNIEFKLLNNHINTNYKSLFNSIKVLIPHILRNIISYIVNLIIFLVLFYILKINNNLEHILVANFFSGVVGLGILILLNYNPYFHNNHIKRNTIYVLINLVKICISGYLIYLLYNFISIPIIISKLIGDFILLVGVELIKNKIFSYI